MFTKRTVLMYLTLTFIFTSIFLGIDILVVQNNKGRSDARKLTEIRMHEHLVLLRENRLAVMEMIKIRSSQPYSDTTFATLLSIVQSSRNTGMKKLERAQTAFLATKMDTQVQDLEQELLKLYIHQQAFFSKIESEKSITQIQKYLQSQEGLELLQRESELILTLEMESQSVQDLHQE